MLVLSRKSGEGLFLELPGGEVVRIWIEGDGGRRMRVVMDAPRGVVIHRMTADGRLEGSSEREGVR